MTATAHGQTRPSRGRGRRCRRSSGRSGRQSEKIKNEQDALFQVSLVCSFAPTHPGQTTPAGSPPAGSGHWKARWASQAARLPNPDELIQHDPGRREQQLPARRQQAQVAPALGAEVHAHVLSGYRRTAADASAPNARPGIRSLRQPAGGSAAAAPGCPGNTRALWPDLG